MDLLSATVGGLLGGLFTCGIGLLAARIALRDLESRASEFVDGLIVEKVTGFLKLLHDKPEIFKPVANGLMGDLQKIIELPDLKVAGQPVSGDTIGAIIPYLPKKWRGPAMIAQMFFGKGDEKKSEVKSHPFG